MARLFFGVPLPARIRDELELLTEGIPSARWVPEENFHVTLAFLGEISEREILDVDQAARAVRADPFTLRMQSVGVFPRKPPARVLWAGLHAEPQLVQLSKKLERELSLIGYQPERRRFHPHVTLARLSRDAPREAVSDWLARYLNFRSQPFAIAQFQLLSSQLTCSGSEYRVLRVYPIRR